MSVIVEKLSPAFAASCACVACAGDDVCAHSGLGVAPCYARIGTKLTCHFSFAGRRHLVGTASRNSSTGAPLRALSACEAVSTRTFVDSPSQLRLANRSDAWHPSFEYEIWNWRTYQVSRNPAPLIGWSPTEGYRVRKTAALSSWPTQRACGAI